MTNYEALRNQIDNASEYSGTNLGDFKLLRVIALALVDIAETLEGMSGDCSAIATFGAELTEELLHE